MSFTSFAVANEFITHAKRDGRQLTPMQLVKLSYYAQGYFLAITDNPLINEKTEAWQYGPVIPSIYHEFKQFGNDGVSRFADEWLIDDEVTYPKISDSGVNHPEDTELASAVISQVYSTYGKLSGLELSDLTHQPGTPWSVTVSNISGEVPNGQDIDDHLILSHFEKLLGVSDDPQEGIDEEVATID